MSTSAKLNMISAMDFRELVQLQKSHRLYFKRSENEQRSICIPSRSLLVAEILCDRKQQKDEYLESSIGLIDRKKLLLEGD
jgi:hypothetical protein